jgi:hypothetical protein
MSFRRYRDYQDGEFYVVFADTSAGGGDWCAAQFLSKTKIDVPVVYHSPESATVMTPMLHNELETIFDKTGIAPVVAYERNNGGSFELERLSRLNRLQKYRIYTMKALDTEGRLVDTDKLGWDTNTATRPKMLQDGKEAIDGQLLRIYDKPTVTEMFSFVTRKTPGGWRVEAEQSAHDDLVMALLGGWQLYQTEQPIVKDDFYMDEPDMFDKEGFFV